MTFDSFISYQARQRPAETAIITASGSLSFADLDAMVDRFAGALAGLALPEDAVCAVEFRNPVTHWLILLALGRLAICSACAKDEAVSFRITDQPQPGGAAFFASDEWVTAVSTRVPARFVPPPAAPGAPGRMLLSSGTTGVPRRVQLSWELIDRNIRNALIAYGPLGHGPWLINIGVDTVFGFTVTLTAWASGHAVLFRGDLDLASLLTRFAPALVGMVPIHLQDELDVLPAGFERRDGMRIVLAGGLPSPALAQAARRRLTADIRTVYGASECGAVAIADTRLLDRHPNAAGYVMPGVTLDIIDEAGHSVTAGLQGEIRIRSDRLGVAEGFRDGWFHPGDLGRRLEDGLLLVDGRCDDLMNLGGIKILPGEIEAALRGVAGVADLAVFAVPYAARVGQWCVAVVLEAGASREAILAQIERRLPPLPLASLLYVPQIPRNAMGKVERLRLVELARAHAAALLSDDEVAE